MVTMIAVNVEPDRLRVGSRESINRTVEQVQHQNYTSQCSRQEEFEDNRIPNTSHGSLTGSTVLEQGQSPVDNAGVSSSTILPPAPLCRQFWKAGNYSDAHGSKVNLQSGKTFLHVHPMFLHSNATSHKWAFGAIAELLDNAIDEIQNGATFVKVDKILNPRDGGSALLIQVESGVADGNGFKTSSMRLGADVVVFTRHMLDRIATQSIGLLSYSFLMQMGHDRIVVPMVDYEFNAENGKLEISQRHTNESFKANLSLLLQWSPYSTESELLKLFDDIGLHGTKVVIYNLWNNDDGNLELDFNTDPQDILVEGDCRKKESPSAWRIATEQHIAKRLQYSLHAYMSILYLRIPETFSLILRGQVVMAHNLADDLKFPEYILYKPQAGGLREVHVITTIGFVKDAPLVNIHGFNIYHKNRLIKPFMQVLTYTNNRGRGVVGILEANYIQPTHSKQDFERTSLFQKLEVRLKDMACEYWDYHCGLIGYHVERKSGARRSAPDPPIIPQTCHADSARSNQTFPSVGTTQTSSPVLGFKRKEHSNSAPPETVRKLPRHGEGVIDNSASSSGGQISQQQQQNTVAVLMQDNKKLRADLSEYEIRKEELNLKVIKLTKELEGENAKYDRLMAELTLLGDVKLENQRVNIVP
ncbi:unnamed protein product [Linum tenue]|uniref:Morc S5 domain-containing protein n=1 Tax=Linum tenue TaxID=586396 RepID=A0AAV0QT49_9ROSI|nr:unnamed protein product [Linum tenue]